MTDTTESKKVTLTAKEYQVVQQLLKKGAANKELAEQMHVSTMTLKTHLRSIYNKCETKTCRELLVWLRYNTVVIEEQINETNTMAKRKRGRQGQTKG
jgi:DNA-binding CsgD family transcriptional regulator